MQKCEEDEDSDLTKSATYKKAGTNKAVTLEKLGSRDEAVETLNKLKGNFGNEVRVYNNLGIIQKRNGDKEGAFASYEHALTVDPKSFFPNYNLGVLLAQDRTQHDRSIEFLQKALDQANKANETLYEINVLINMALIFEINASHDEALQKMERAQLLDPANQNIEHKIMQLKEMIENRKQGITSPADALAQQKSLNQEKIQQQMQKDSRQQAQAMANSNRSGKGAGVEINDDINLDNDQMLAGVDVKNPLSKQGQRSESQMRENAYDDIDGKKSIEHA
jgi:tetratricopeptide (TPR) repeat protein